MIDAPIADALKEVVADDLETAVSMELPRAGLLEWIDRALLPYRNALRVKGLLAVRDHAPLRAIELQHRHRARAAVRDQQPVERRPRKARPGAIRIVIARPEVTI